MGRQGLFIEAERAEFFRQTPGRMLANEQDGARSALIDHSDGLPSWSVKRCTAFSPLVPRFEKNSSKLIFCQSTS